jgi:hypothetical protein
MNIKQLNIKMKLLPRFSKLSIVAILVSAIFLLDGCAPKPGCGSKRDHRRRKKSVKRFAPGMSYQISDRTKVLFG